MTTEPGPPTADWATRSESHPVPTTGAGPGAGGRRAPGVAPARDCHQLRRMHMVHHAAAHRAAPARLGAAAPSHGRVRRGAPAAGAPRTAVAAGHPNAARPVSVPDTTHREEQQP